MIRTIGSARNVPSSVPNLRVWLDASQLGLSGGEQIGIWKDSSRNNNNATQTTASKMPLFEKSSHLGGRPAIDFNNAQGLEVGYDVSAQSEFTIFLVLHLEDAAVNDRLFEQQDAGPANGWAFIVIANPARIQLGIRNGAAVVAALSHQIELGKNFIITGMYKENDVRIYGNGSLTGQDTAATMTSATGLAGIGARSVGLAANFFEGRIGEILVYNSFLSDGHRTLIQRYLSKKYHIPLY